MNKINLLFMCLFLQTNLYADSFEDPVVRCYFSTDSNHFIKIIPGQFLSEKQYKNYRNDSDKQFLQAGWNNAVGILYYKIDNDTILLWRRQLPNPLAPEDVLISKDACYIVAFDDWGLRGFTKNTMILYDKSGKLLKQYSLKGISPLPLSQYARTVSSIVWKKRAYFEADSNYLTIEFINKEGNVYIRKYNCVHQRFEN